MDADDLLLSGAIEFLVNLSKKYPEATVCAANHYNVAGGKNHWVHLFRKKVLFHSR